MDLNGQFPTMDLEDRQIIVRSLDHDFASSAFTHTILFKWAMFVTKDRFHGLYVKQRTGSINNAMEYLIHSTSTRKPIAFL